MTGFLENSKISFSGIFVMQSFVLSLNSLLSMFTTQKITKLTSFDVTIWAKFFCKAIKLILSGGKNGKILITVFVLTCYA